MKNPPIFNPEYIRSILQSSDFKEDSVRETIILPILYELGYKEDNIIRSKQLDHPFLKVGSKKIPIKLIPDYLLKIKENYAWVLEAKSPNEKIIDSEHVEQVYSYSAHPEVRSVYFALCNGEEFALFKREATNEPILFFRLENLQEKWETLKRFLSIDSFQDGKAIVYDSFKTREKTKEFDYLTRPLLSEISVQKQSAKRHFGVHGYFTKQSWNIVSEYIKNFSAKGDLILDPFGGSGVTAIEAMMLERKAINIDINPLAVFLVNSLVAPVKFQELSEEFEKIKLEYLENEPKTKKQIAEALEKYPYPKGIPLPKGSDVESIEQLFSKKQLAQLSYLKFLIKKVKNKNVRSSLLLSFSSSVTKTNRTYHNSSSRDENAGNAAPFAYYRYRIAKNEVHLDLMKTFETKFKKMFAAKKEISYFINSDTIENLQIYKSTATKLKNIPDLSVDYIYTDPPYGKKIPYLDLSIMWNAWLDLKVTEEDYAEEAIEGGEKQKAKLEYNRLIAESIKEMYRVLKFDRWMSFVFAHKDPEFWHLIIETAENCGFEYIGAVPQKNGQSSFKKRQNPFTVLSGQLIINFKKKNNPRAILRAHLGMNIDEIVIQTIEGIIAKKDGATLEEINDELIIKGLELGFLDLLKKEYVDLTPILLQNFDFEENKEIYILKKESKFQTHIDVKLRIRYYLISFLRRMERENKIPTFDEIILHILPLLKNGITPEKQTIQSVLEDIAEHIGENKWKLSSKGQMNLF